MKRSRGKLKLEFVQCHSKQHTRCCGIRWRRWKKQKKFDVFDVFDVRLNDWKSKREDNTNNTRRTRCVQTKREKKAKKKKLGNMVVRAYHICIRRVCWVSCEDERLPEPTGEPCQLKLLNAIVKFCECSFG